MSLITRYAVYFDLLMPQIPSAGQAKIAPLDYLKDSFGSPTNDPMLGVAIYDLGQPSGIGENVGFGMVALKNGQLLPHSIVCLQMDDSIVAAPGTDKTAIEDAIAGLAAWGGRGITEEKALELATYLFPASQFSDPMTQKTYNVSAPKLVNHILVRDITEAVA